MKKPFLFLSLFLSLGNLKADELDLAIDKCDIESVANYLNKNSISQDRVNELTAKLNRTVVKKKYDLDNKKYNFIKKTILGGLTSGAITGLSVRLIKYTLKMWPDGIKEDLHRKLFIGFLLGAVLPLPIFGIYSTILYKDFRNTTDEYEKIDVIIKLLNNK